MFECITYMSDDFCTVKINNDKVTHNLMNLHLILEDATKKILAEVEDVDDVSLKAKFLGEIVNGKLISGTIRKPSLDASIRVINKEEIPLITGFDAVGFMKLGVSPFYDDYPIFLDVNNFFSNHFAVFGNTGSGKSCGVSRVFQNLFHDTRLNPYKANVFIFDSSGEYYNAFSNLNQINVQYNYRYISTNEVEGLGEKLRLPIYLLNRDDLALLLQCDKHSQLPIIERMLKLALVFSQNDMDSEAYKNYLIAKAIMTILYTNETAPNKRNEIFSIIASCSTEQFNLESPIQGVGYVRKFRECFLIDNSGNFTESVLLTNYVTSFIKDEYENYEPHKGVFYDLDTMEKALNFTLISEGWLRNEQTYGDSVTIRVRLHSLIVGQNAKYFDVHNYVSLESFISSLLVANEKKYQIVNINLTDIDDEFAKVLTKIYSRLIFDFSKGLTNRASIPFHIVLEEAHRYIQNDRDRFLFGYNIFERIAKEGRKYGVILGLISQRPVEISDTVISQCTNFLIFKINHPVDVEYIRKMVPNVTEEIVEKQKTLQSGTCLGFGLAFRIPIIIKMEMPNPEPSSGNCDVVKIWNGGIVESMQSQVSISSPSVNSAPVSAPAPVTNVAPPSNEIIPSNNNTSVPQQVSVPTVLNNTPEILNSESSISTGGASVGQGGSTSILQPMTGNTTNAAPKAQNTNNDFVLSNPDIPPIPSGLEINSTNEKFDDSFIISENSVERPSILPQEAPVEKSANLSQGNSTEFPMTYPQETEDIFTSNPSSDGQSFGLNEIAEVNISSNGMVQSEVPSDNGISLDLDDNDDDDDKGFE